MNLGISGGKYYGRPARQIPEYKGDGSGSHG